MQQAAFVGLQRVDAPFQQGIAVPVASVTPSQRHPDPYLLGLLRQQVPVVLGVSCVCMRACALCVQAYLYRV
jgi:hypothetical protein